MVLVGFLSFVESDGLVGCVNKVELDRYLYSVLRRLILPEYGGTE